MFVKPSPSMSPAASEASAGLSPTDFSNSSGRPSLSVSYEGFSSLFCYLPQSRKGHFATP